MVAGNLRLESIYNYNYIIQCASVRISPIAVSYELTELKKSDTIG